MEEKQNSVYNVDPHIIALTGSGILFNEEEFVFQLTSGNQVKRFLATPKHAKRILLHLKDQIGAYEKQFGEIKTNLNSDFDSWENAFDKK